MDDSGLSVLVSPPIFGGNLIADDIQMALTIYNPIIKIITHCNKSSARGPIHSHQTTPRSLPPASRTVLFRGAQRSDPSFGCLLSVLCEWGCLEMGGEVLTPPTQLYKLINNLNKMNRTEAATLWTAAASRSPIFERGAQSSSPSILLPKIHDQQFYLCLTSTLLRLAGETGVPHSVLSQLADSLLTARGLNFQGMLKNANQGQGHAGKRRESYDWLQKSCSSQQQVQLLEKVQQELSTAREKESQYNCLKKYIRQREEEIAPVGISSPTSRKDRFKRMVRGKTSKRNVQSSNFYKFGVTEILENSFKSQNQCYRTINNFTHLKTMFGHSADEDLESYSQIYNAIYDRAENLIISAGEEGTVKVWHKNTGALVKNLKGHTDYLNKIDTSKCNKYLLTSGGDGVRFFDLKSLRPLGGWKADSIADITSFMDNGSNIFVFGDKCELYLLTEEVMLAKSETQLTIDDFFIFDFSELIGKQNGPVLVITISPQRSHLIIGLQKGQFILIKVSELLEDMKVHRRGEVIGLPALSVNQAHYDQIIEVKWSENSNVWATGSKDGRCCLWEYRGQQAYLLHTLSVNRGHKGRKKRFFSCTYICWNCVFSHFAAGFQQTIDQEDAERGQGEVLVYSIKQQKVTCELSQDISLKFGGIRAMDAHPYYPNILLICEAQGHIILFDLFLTCIVNVFQERGYHILHPQFSLIPTECRFAQDGMTLIVGSEYGSVSLYGYDSKPFYSLCPSEQFLATDFKQFTIQDNSMKAVPLTLDFRGDINEYPKGDVLNIRGQAHKHMIKMDVSSLLSYFNSLSPLSLHNPQMIIDISFLRMIDYNLRQVALQEQSYNKTYEQIQNNRLIILFHERERQYAAITSITSHKLQQFKVSHLNLNKTIQVQQDQPISIARNHRNVPVRTTRNLNRLAQRQRINYADNFSENQNNQELNSEEEEVLEEDLPEEISQSQSDSQNVAVIKRTDRSRNRITRNTRQHNNISYIEEEVEEPERLIHRRHRDFENEFIEEEHQPHKRVKLSDQIHSEQDEPKKFSRLRKHAQQSEMIEQGNDCYRCQLVKSTQFCHKCEYTQQFCSQCAELRGRIIKDKYKCVICLFLSNDAEEEYQHVTEDLYRQTKRSFQTFLPQLKDRLRFFFQGYQEFLVQNVQKLNNRIVKNNPAFRLLPQTQNALLVSTPLCQVESIEYYFPVKSDLASSSKRTPGKGEPCPILMLVGLKPIMAIDEETDDDIFWVFYTPGQQFLVLESIYAQVGQKDILSKVQLFDLIQVKEEEMQIVQIGPFQDRYPESLWKMMKIRKTEGKRLRGNTKEIQRRMNIWKICQNVEVQRFDCHLESSIAERLVRHLQNWIKANSLYCLFVDYVDFDIYPEYRRQIPVGICLQTILQRLKNNYYGGQESLDMDIKLLHQNSVRFNGPAHQVTQKAEELVAKLLALVKSDQIARQSNSHSRVQEKELEDSTSKKKKNVEADRMYNSRETFKSIKNDHLRKRKQSSSDYQQNSDSVSGQVRVITRGTRIKHKHEPEAKRITRSRTHRI